jgi:hypothetical protein
MESFQHHSLNPGFILQAFRHYGQWQVTTFGIMAWVLIATSALQIKPGSWALPTKKESRCTGQGAQISPGPQRPAKK